MHCYCGAAWRAAWVRPAVCSGYDSAGVGFIRDGADSITVIKKAGKVANLRSATETQDCAATIGIAHTRWATHGPPNDKNSHPHFSADKTIAVVHNGIIENYRELQTMLERVHGYKFASETDTELLAHLAHQVRQCVPSAACRCRARRRRRSCPARAACALRCSCRGSGRRGVVVRGGGVDAAVHRHTRSCCETTPVCPSAHAIVLRNDPCVPLPSSREA
jgi:hypothetical protein